MADKDNHVDYNFRLTGLLKSFLKRYLNRFFNVIFNNRFLAFSRRTRNWTCWRWTTSTTQSSWVAAREASASPSAEAVNFNRCHFSSSESPSTVRPQPTDAFESATRSSRSTAITRKTWPTRRPSSWSKAAATLSGFSSGEGKCPHLH